MLRLAGHHMPRGMKRTALTFIADAFEAICGQKNHLINRFK
jgi:hypothetical protein